MAKLSKHGTLASDGRFPVGATVVVIQGVDDWKLHKGMVGEVVADDGSNYLNYIVVFPVRGSLWLDQRYIQLRDNGPKQLSLF